MEALQDTHILVRSETKEVVGNQYQRSFLFEMAASEDCIVLSQNPAAHSLLDKPGHYLAQASI